MIRSMKRSILSGALTFGVALSALITTSCETTENRISKNPEIYQRLSANDQAVVSRGQIRPGMSQNAVWLAWGSPERKITGNMRGHATETWIYITYETAPYPLLGTLWAVGEGLRFRPRCCLCPDTSSRTRVHILRRSVLRSVLLRLHPAEHSSPVQDGHIRKRAGSVVPVHGTVVTQALMSSEADTSSQFFFGVLRQ